MPGLKPVLKDGLTVAEIQKLLQQDDQK